MTTQFTVTPDCTNTWFFVEDTRPNCVTYEWCVVDANQGNSVVFSSPRGKQTYVKFLAPGNYCLFTKGDKKLQ